MELSFLTHVVDKGKEHSFDFCQISRMRGGREEVGFVCQCAVVNEPFLNNKLKQHACCFLFVYMMSNHVDNCCFLRGMN